MEGEAQHCTYQPSNPHTKIKQKNLSNPPQLNSLKKQGPTGRVFSISGGFRSGSEQKSRIAGGYLLARSVEIFNRVFLGTSFSFGYFRYQKTFGYWESCWLAGGYRVPLGPWSCVYTFIFFWKLWCYENSPKGQLPVSMYVKLGMTLKVALMMSAIERLMIK